MIEYKVRDKNTGLFSTGGCSYAGRPGENCYQPRPNGWSKKGKIWTGLGPLRTHLNQFYWIPENWEVVEYEYTLTKETLKPASQISNRAEKLREKEEKKKRLAEEKKAALAKLSPRDKELLGIR